MLLSMSIIMTTFWIAFAAKSVTGIPCLALVAWPKASSIGFRPVGNVIARSTSRDCIRRVLCWRCKVREQASIAHIAIKTCSSKSLNTIGAHHSAGVVWHVHGQAWLARSAWLTPATGNIGHLRAADADMTIATMVMVMLMSSPIPNPDPTKAQFFTLQDGCGLCISEPA